MALQEWWKNPALSGAFGNSPQPETKEAMPQPIGGKYGYTGKGPDGVAQPDRRVAGMGNGGYDAHEAEFVVDADTTQAIGPDILNAMQTSVKTGKPPDLNKIREALGIPAKDGYQEGGLTRAVPEPKAKAEPLGQATAVATPDNQNRSQMPGGNPFIGQNTINKIKEKAKMSGNIPFKPTQPDIGGFKVDNQPNIPITPIGEQKGFQTQPDIKIDQVQPIKPIGPEAKPSEDAQTVATEPIGVDAKVATKPDANQQAETEGGNIGNVVNPPQKPDDFDPIEYMKGIMGGDNPYFEQLKNMYSQDMGGAGAASMAAMRQLATQSGMSPEQIASMSATFGRDTMQSVSKMLGSLALGQSEMQYNAAKDAFGMEMQNKQFEFAKKQYGDLEGGRIAQDINNGMTLEMIQKKYPHLGITQKDYDSMKSMSQMGWQQEVFNQQMDFAKQQYGDLEGQRIANLVNQGWSLEQLQKEFPDKNITQEDYDQLQSYSNMGFQKEQWEYSKKVDAFNQLMQQGGEKNFQNAAKLFNSMFGTQVDFSNALTEENKQKFNESWNNMTGSISGGMSFEDWKKSAIADGTYDNLNMTDADIKTMYENMQLSSNPTYQALTQYDKMLEKGIFTQEQYDRVTKALKYGITHPEGFVFSDGFQVKDENGNEVEFFKTQEEADEFIKNNPDKKYSSEIIPEGWVEYGGGSGTNTGPDPDPDEMSDEKWDNMSSTEQNEYFQDSMPAEKLEEWGNEAYDKWVNAGKPRNWDEYLETIGGEIADYTKAAQDKYKESGWEAPVGVSDWVRNLVEEGRSSFLGDGQGVISMTKDDIDNMNFEDVMKNPDFKQGNTMMVKGYPNPMVIGQSYRDYIEMFDLTTGKRLLIARRKNNEGDTTKAVFKG